MALAFTLPDTNGTPTPLHVDGAPAAVVVFTCNHCPYAPPSLSCRVYRLADGRFSPTPDLALLRAALAERELRPS